MEKQDNYKLYLEEGNLYNKKLASLKVAEEKVAWLLQRYPKLRNNDKLLVFYYWKYVNVVNFNLLNDNMIDSLTSSETIRRVRQKIQNEYRMFLPTDEIVIKRRRICQEAVHDWAINKVNWKV